MSVTLTIQIRGMSCEHCVCAIEQALHALPGVEAADVAMGRACVVFDSGAIHKSQIFEGIRAAGPYDVSGFSHNE